MEDIFDRVRELAAKLPKAQESTHYGTPVFKVRKKMFARMHDKMGDVLVVRRPLPDRAAMVAAEPAKHFFTPHYDDYPAMLVRLPTVNRKELRAVPAGDRRLVRRPPRVGQQATQFIEANGRRYGCDLARVRPQPRASARGDEPRLTAALEALVAGINIVGVAEAYRR